MTTRKFIPEKSKDAQLLELLIDGISKELQRLTRLMDESIESRKEQTNNIYSIAK